MGGLEEHVFKRVLDFVHFPTVVVHGAIPYVAESSYYHPLYVRRQSLPFAVLCDDIATHATERLAAIELALGEGVAAVIGLRRGPGPPASSLAPPGGLPALTDAEVPYADIPLPARRELIDAGARLRASDPFAGLSAAEATTLRRLMERREYEPGATIVRQGEPGDALYVIEAGVAEVRVTDPAAGPARSARWASGEHFGEIALLGSGRRTADVVAVSAVTVLELRSEAYERYLTGVEDVEEELGRAAASRLAADRRRERIEPLAGIDPLWLDAEAMRRIGYRTVDMLVERLADPARQPTAARGLAGGDAATPERRGARGRPGVRRHPGRAGGARAPVRLALGPSGLLRASSPAPRPSRAHSATSSRARSTSTPAPGPGARARATSS